MRTRAAVTLSIGLLILLASPGSASAFRLSSGGLRWPFDTITYHVADGRQAGPVNRAMRAWSRARVGWRFKRVRTRSQADIAISVSLTRGRSICIGRGLTGFRFGQQQILIAGRCHDGGLLTLGAAHEVGHVLGLGEERRRCAVMNPNFTGRGRRVRPVGCPRGPAYWKSPVRVDDRRGARASARRRIGFHARLCDPSDEQPIVAHEPLCKYSYRCKGRAGLHGSQLAVSAETYIRRFCTRLLRVVSATPQAPPPPLGSGEASGSFSGVTGQGQPIRFAARRNAVRGLRFNVRYTCTDGTTRFARPDVIDSLPDNLEHLGPFPTFRASDGRFRRSFEAESETALYHLSGSFGQGVWRGTLRVIEGISEANDQPDPDGAIICDTGTVSFTAHRP